jgi:hypothetical protein
MFRKTLTMCAAAAAIGAGALAAFPAAAADTQRYAYPPPAPPPVVVAVGPQWVCTPTYQVSRSWHFLHHFKQVERSNEYCHWVYPNSTH